MSYFNSAEIFVQCKFHHPVFARSEVIVLTNQQTNKQTPLKTFNFLRYATTLGDIIISHLTTVELSVTVLAFVFF